MCAIQRSGKRKTIKAHLMSVLAVLIVFHMPLHTVVSFHHWNPASVNPFVNKTVNIT